MDEPIITQLTIDLGDTRSPGSRKTGGRTAGSRKAEGRSAGRSDERTGLSANGQAGPKTSPRKRTRSGKVGTEEPHPTASGGMLPGTEDMTETLTDDRDPVSLSRRGLLNDLLSLYLATCRGQTVPGGAAGKKTDGTRRFPNPAGFCRFLGVGMSRMTALAAEEPDAFDALCAVFEDEALNSGISATVLTPYFKKRLGYADKESPAAAGGYDDGNVRLLFEHDVYGDGI